MLSAPPSLPDANTDTQLGREPLRLLVCSDTYQFVDALQAELIGEAEIVWNDLLSEFDIVVMGDDIEGCLEWMQENAERRYPVPVILLTHEWRRDRLLTLMEISGVVTILPNDMELPIIAERCRKVIDIVQAQRANTCLLKALMQLTADVRIGCSPGYALVSELPQLMQDLCVLESRDFLVSMRNENAERLQLRARAATQGAAHEKQLMIVAPVPSGAIYGDIPFIQRAVTLMLERAIAVTDHGGLIDMVIQDGTGQGCIRITSKRWPYLSKGLDCIAVAYLESVSRIHNGRFHVFEDRSGRVTQSLVLPDKPAALAAERLARISSSRAIRSRQS